MIVADAGLIIGFARLGRLDLLRQVVGELVIPAAVYEELVVRGRQRAGATDADGIRQAYCAANVCNCSMVAVVI